MNEVIDQSFIKKKKNQKGATTEDEQDILMIQTPVPGNHVYICIMCLEINSW